MIAKDNPYIPIILSLVPRVLTNLDRDSTSPTYGSFDRNYWHLKIRNFSSAILQQAVLLLAICYKNDFEGNVYYNNERLKQWAVASLEYWARIQNRDGSYDEYWKGEGSFPATAFSTFSATEAYLLLNLEDSRLFREIERSIHFLYQRTERFAVNQEIASIAAIVNMYLITQERGYLDLSDKKIETLKKLQTKDGFFAEHGGPDIGYSSVALEYLSILYEKTGRDDIKNICNSLIEFLSYFIHPDGTVGGRYASRDTEYFMLGGLESCSCFNPLCTSMLGALTNNIIRREYIHMGIDERYLLHYVGYSLARALLKYQHRTETESLPFKRNIKKLFQEASLYIISDSLVYLIISLFKGGAFRLYFDGRLLCEDTGYRIVKGRRIFHTEIGESFRYAFEQDRITIVKSFYEKNYTTITPLRSFCLFLYSLLLGNSLWNYCRKRFIKGARKTNISLRRKFILGEDRIIIEDEITNAPRATLIKNPSESIQNTPSSKFFQIQQLENMASSVSSDIHKNFQLSTVIDLKNRSVE